MPDSIDIIALFEFIQEMNVRIINRDTGTPQQFSDTLGIRKDSLKFYLAILSKQEGAIGYCRKEKTYYYKKKTPAFKWRNSVGEEIDGIFKRYNNEGTVLN